MIEPGAVLEEGLLKAYADDAVLESLYLSPSLVPSLGEVQASHAAMGVSAL